MTPGPLFYPIAFKSRKTVCDCLARLNPFEYNPAEVQNIFGREVLMGKFLAIVGGLAAIVGGILLVVLLPGWRAPFIGLVKG